MREILIISATEFEQTELAQRLESPINQVVVGKRWVTGTRGNAKVRLVAGGLGAVNTAHALSCVLQSQIPELVLQVGIGGAYPTSGLELGALAVATIENYGDLGVRTREGWQSSAAIGIPLVRGANDFYNHFPLDDALVLWAQGVLAKGNSSLRVGPFVTVQECSGTIELGRERCERFAAICENMEGAAAAHICRLFEVPFLEVRGISNMVEDRHRDAWDIPGAAAAAQEAAWDMIGKFQA